MLLLFFLDIPINESLQNPKDNNFKTLFKNSKTYQKCQNIERYPYNGKSSHLISKIMIIGYELNNLFKIIKQRSKDVKAAKEKNKQKVKKKKKKMNPKSFLVKTQLFCLAIRLRIVNH